MLYKRISVAAAAVFLLATAFAQTAYDCSETAENTQSDNEPIPLISKEPFLVKRTYPTISRGNLIRTNEHKEKEKPNQEVKEQVQLMPWFGKAEKVFAIGTAATVTDINTGLKVQAKRTYGYNHADVETITSDDTETLKNIAGGSWNWTRRPVIVEVNGTRIAASITAMPHAGLENAPMNSYVKGRSGGFGSGVNLDTIKGNNMDGHFDIHFYGSKTHSTNKSDKAHQECVQKAYKYEK